MKITFTLADIERSEKEHWESEQRKRAREQQRVRESQRVPGQQAMNIAGITSVPLNEEQMLFQ